MVKTYIRRPSPVKALQWTGMNLAECKSFAKDELDIQYPTLDNSFVLLVLNTPKGKMQVCMGAYIIQGADGEFSTCRESVFVRTYEQIA